MQDKKVTRAKIVIDALRNHYGMKVGEFAEKLGVKASTVSTWANRDSIDEDLVFRKCEGVLFDFLKTGTDPIFSTNAMVQPEVKILGAINTEPVVTANFPPVVKMVVDRMLKMDEEEQLDVLDLVRAKKRKVISDDTPHQLADAIGTQVHGTATEKRVGFKSKKKATLYTQLADPPDLKTQPAPRVANG